MKRGLAFLSDAGPAVPPGGPGYGARLSRLRWVRAAGAEGVAEWRSSDGAPSVLAGAEAWVLVADATALPHAPPEGSPCHTLRELERAVPGASPGSAPAAIAFRPGDLPPRDNETVQIYFERLLKSGPGFYEVLPAFAVGDPSESERLEVVERLPAGSARILDVGCGAGGLGLARARRPGWRLTGVEKDPVRAARARARGAYERLLEGELEDVLPRLAREGARFDAILLADVLEHVEDPVSALQAVRALAAEGARLLVVVPNVGHLSLVRDLLLGRHDPVPAGLCDAGHLRWFSKWFLAEVIEEAGWTLEKIEGLPGAPPPDPEPFLTLARDWPGADLESLGTYQWVATATAATERVGT